MTLYANFFMLSELRRRNEAKPPGDAFANEIEPLAVFQLTLNFFVD